MYSSVILLLQTVDWSTLESMSSIRMSNQQIHSAIVIYALVPVLKSVPSPLLLSSTNLGTFPKQNSSSEE